MQIDNVPNGGLEANGYRFYTENGELFIQDLVTGRWASFGLYRSLDAGVPAIMGGARVLAEAIYRLPELGAPYIGGELARAVTAAEAIAALCEAAPTRQRPFFPVPRISTIARFATPYPGCRPMGSSLRADVTAIAMVATALAWRDGEARDFELEHDLAVVLGDQAATWLPREIARLRTAWNVIRNGRGPYAVWKTRRDWSADPWPDPAPSKSPKPRHSRATTDGSRGYHPPA